MTGKHPGRAAKVVCRFLDEAVTKDKDGVEGDDIEVMMVFLCEVHGFFVRGEFACVVLAHWVQGGNL